MDPKTLLHEHAAMLSLHRARACVSEPIIEFTDEDFDTETARLDQLISAFGEHAEQIDHKKEKQVNMLEQIRLWRKESCADWDRWKAQITSKTGVSSPWYDWFCEDWTLQRRGVKLFAKAAQLVTSPKFKAERCYIFFKNNCPMVGPLYDDFRVCDLDADGAVLYTISFGDKRQEGFVQVWGVDNDFNGPLVDGTWREIKKFFNVV